MSDTNNNNIVNNDIINSLLNKFNRVSLANARSRPPNGTNTSTRTPANARIRPPNGTNTSTRTPTNARIRPSGNTHIVYGSTTAVGSPLKRKRNNAETIFPPSTKRTTHGRTTTRTLGNNNTRQTTTQGRNNAETIFPSSTKRPTTQGRTTGRNNNNRQTTTTQGRTTGRNNNNNNNGSKPTRVKIETGIQINRNSNSNNNNNNAKQTTFNNSTGNMSVYSRVTLPPTTQGPSRAAKNRKDIIRYIKKLIDEQTLNNGSDLKDVKNGLTYMYSKVFTEDQFIINTKLPIGEFKKRIKKQLFILQKQRVKKKGGVTTWGINSKQEMNIMFLIWCDMIHDETLPLNYDKFSVFINSNIIKSLFGDNGNKSRRKVIHTRFIRTLLDILDNPNNFHSIDGTYQDKTTKRLFDALTSNNMITEIIKTKTNPQPAKNGKPAKKPTWKNGFEACWKKYINAAITEGDEGWSKRMRDNSHSIPVNKIRPGMFNNRGKGELLVSIDQENDHKDVSEALLRSKQLNTKIKALQPTVSIASLVDPGSEMVSNSIRKNKNILNHPNYNKIGSGLKWNLTPYHIKLGNMDVKTKLVETRTATPKKGDKFNYTYQYFINDDDKPYDIDVSAKKAKSGTEEEKISKFMGDFYQILTAIKMAPTYNYYPASGDGMFCLIFAYIYKIVRREDPKMIILKGKEPRETNSLTFLNLKSILNVNNNNTSRGTQVNPGNSRSSTRNAATTMNWSKSTNNVTSR